MDKNEVEEFLSKMKGGKPSYPFGPDALVYKVMGKMYVLVSQQEELSRVTLKVNPPDGEVLIDQYDSISPGYYMNKKHWITISLDGEVSKEIIQDLSEKSYKLVVGKLTKKDKEKLKEII